MNDFDLHDSDRSEKVSENGITAEEYRRIIKEAENQPRWRIAANKEMDYLDGKQLDSDWVGRVEKLGITPAIENRIKPALLAVMGYEAASRTDFRVVPYGGEAEQDIADAINYKLNKAESESGADRACSEAFKSQIACGIGWVEVSRNDNPMEFPYVCSAIHRNSIHWDMKSGRYDLDDARWLIRRRWVDPIRLKNVFPKFKNLFQEMAEYGRSWRSSIDLFDEDNSTGLMDAWRNESHPSLSEMQMFDDESNDVCIYEIWYRRWIDILFLRFGDGRVIEYDPNNDSHVIALAKDEARLVKSNVSRMRRSYWVDGVKLHDSDTPFNHQKFPYVAFFGFKEDNTGVPYGYVRDMIYEQDQLNAMKSKLRILTSSIRSIRTAGALKMTDEQFRNAISSPNADIVLDDHHMAKPGARFEVDNNIGLTASHLQLLSDSRSAIDSVSGITSSFMGARGSATSGMQESIQVEQSNQSLASVMDNFRHSRSQVGELLLSMIVADIGSAEHSVIIEGDVMNPERTIVLNQVIAKSDDGKPYLSNDMQMVRMKVTLDDVPSTNSYRAQQLAALSEVAKSLPAEYQVLILPYLIALSDIPHKKDIVEDIRNVSKAETPEAKAAALANDIRLKELEIKKLAAENKAMLDKARAVQIGVESHYSALQAGGVVAGNPAIAPVSDVILQSSGFEVKSGDDPNIPTAGDAGNMGQVKGFEDGNGNISPIPTDSGNHANQGIETTAISDNNQV